VAAYLAYKGELTYAAVLLGLILPQMFFQAKYLLKDPIEYDVKYQVRLQWKIGRKGGQAIPDDYCH
jgi:chlorophyll synthase